uniref:Uncharacterized protein LOC117346827 isoform X2 n=1 Tax=Geotrypetes seraphini TaxID=260995 RepID=A0A6P8NQ70_GEOSA|nr:uncharacterized protein LOC117346827 isoform X2 [Geotrypetes seraphini]
MAELEREEEKKTRVEILEQKKQEIKSLEQEIDTMQKEYEQLEQEGERAYQQHYQHTVYQETLLADIKTLEAKILAQKKEISVMQTTVIDRKELLHQKELELETVTRNRKNCALALLNDLENKEQCLMQAKQQFDQRLRQRQETFRHEFPLTPNSQDAINEARRMFETSKKKSLIGLLLSLVVHLIVLLLKKVLQLILRILLFSIFCYVSFNSPMFLVETVCHFLSESLDRFSMAPI